METYYRKYHGRTGTYTYRMTDAEIEFRRKLGTVLGVLTIPPVMAFVFLIAAGVIRL